VLAMHHDERIRSGVAAQEDGVCCERRDRARREVFDQPRRLVVEEDGASAAVAVLDHQRERLEKVVVERPRVGHDDAARTKRICLEWQRPLLL